jgi:hypothetical protein
MLGAFFICKWRLQAKNCDCNALSMGQRLAHYVLRSRKDWSSDKPGDARIFIRIGYARHTI